MCKEYQKPEDFVGTDIWHVTSKTNFERIISDGEIKAEPDIPDELRYATFKGLSYYPLVRSLGGISLFDFTVQEQSAVHYRTAIEFPPYSCSEESSVRIWIEIDRDSIIDRIRPNDYLKKIWKDGNQHRRFIPVYEIAVIGAISTTSFIRSIEVIN